MTCPLCKLQRGMGSGKKVMKIDGDSHKRWSEDEDCSRLMLNLYQFK